MEICCKNSMLLELCKKHIETYINDLGINGLIFNGDLSGVKYYVESRVNFSVMTNNQYIMKWAKLCKKNDIINYLTKKGCCPHVNFNIIRNKSINKSPDYFSIKLKPIHIDNVRGIKYFPITRELTSTEMICLRNPGQEYSWIYTDPIKGIPLDYDGIYKIMRNLNIKYRDGNIPLTITANGEVMYEWNSGDILREIIPIGYSPFVSFQLYIRNNSGELIQPTPENYDKFTINYELGFMPQKVSQFYDHFLFNSTISRYDIPRNFPYNLSHGIFGDIFYNGVPPIETFGKRDYSKDNGKLYNLLHLHSSLIGFSSRYSDFVNENNPPENVVKDYRDYIEHQCKPFQITYQEHIPDSLEKFKKKIVDYGEMCFPYDITPYVWNN